MPLTPIQMPATRDRTKPAAADTIEGRTEAYKLMHELRQRTVQQKPGDPLALADWWSVIEDEPRPIADTYRRVYRLKRETILPLGLWSIRTNNIDGDRGIIAARFEGYQPWWINASEYAWHSSFSKVIESQLMGEDGVPHIPASAYEQRPEPSRHKSQ